jgi:hypothetical protein
MATDRPIDFLSDSKGIYGIGIVYDDVRENQSHWYREPLIFRRDLIGQSVSDERRQMLLHTLPNYRFLGSFEWNLHEVMLNEALTRNPRYQDLEEDFKNGRDDDASWKGDKGKLYRKIKWGQHRRQLIWLNHKLKRLTAEAAEPNALRLARRFHPMVREEIYRAAAISPRALQLIEAFPYLGLHIYCPPDKADGLKAKAPDATKMVERGARLNHVASFMDVPMWARKLKPAVAHWFCYVPYNLHHYLPEKTWEQRLWLRAFMSRGRTDDPELTYWIARNVLKVGNRILPVLNFLSDINDWVMEAKREQPRCITRPFCPDMSVVTVRTENELWHDTVAKCEAAKSAYKIPVPWYPAGQANGYRIVPLDSAEELWKEGRAMHHCVGSYDYRVAAGGCYIYSVRQGDNRIATIELARKDGKVVSQQIRAACNDEPPKEVKAAVRKWVSGLKAA